MGTRLIRNTHVALVLFKVLLMGLIVLISKLGRETLQPAHPERFGEFERRVTSRLALS